MSIITEKSINKNIFPVKKNGPKKKFKNGNLIFSAEEDSEWDHNCYKLIDFLSTKLMNDIMREHGLWTINDTFIQNNLFLLDYKGFCNNINETTEKIRNSEIYNKQIIVSGEELNNSPQFKRVNSTTVKLTIEKIIKFKCKFKHNFLTKTKDKKYTLKNSYLNTLKLNIGPWALLNCEVDNGNISPDGKYYNKKYIFGFGPKFGGEIHSVFFIHNIYTKAYSTIPDKFYSLTNITSVFYRLFLLDIYSKKNKTNNVNIDFNEATTLLHLTAKSKPNLKMTIKRILNELVDNELIKSFTITKYNNINIVK